MNGESFSGMAAGLGILLLGISLVAPSCSSTNGEWTKEDSREFSEAGARVHDLSYGAGHSHGPPRRAGRQRHGEPKAASQQRQAELTAARATFESKQKQLEAARGSGSGFRAFLKWSGLLIALMGVGGYAVGKMRQR